jgi:hypothetical protein
MTSTLSNQFRVSIMLAHMMRSQTCTEQALRFIKPQHILHPAIEGEQWQAAVLDAITAHYDTYHTVPDIATLYHTLVHRATVVMGLSKDDPRFIEVMEKVEAFTGMLKDVSDTTMAVADRTIEWICQEAIRDAEISQAIELARTTPNGLDDLVGNLQSVREKYNGMGAPKVISDIMSLPNESIKRTLTGVSFIDGLFGKGRGMATGCGVAILAAQGAGKTTLAIQFCVSKALLGEPTLFIMTESGFQTSVRSKVISCATGIPFDVISDCKFDMRAAAAQVGMTTHDVDVMQMKLDLIKTNFNVLDLVAIEGELPLIEQELQKMEQRYGRPAGLWALDWAGPLADRIQSNSKRKIDARDLPLRMVADAVANMAARFDNLGIVSHQMAPGLLDKGPYHDHLHNCAQDCKSFTANLKYVLTINQRDRKLSTEKIQSSLQKVGVPKSRDDSPPAPFLVRNVDGAHFVKADGWKQMGKRWVNEKGSLGGNHLPTESTRAATEVET